jgi:hypothetical protein
MKTYANTLALPESIVAKRIHNLDSAATLVYYRVPSAIEQSYVGIESEIITDEDMAELLATPLTVAEQSAIARKQEAFDNAKLTAELKSVTRAEAREYIDENVTDLASAKGVLKILASMIIALRDEVFPELPES